MLEDDPRVKKAKELLSAALKKHIQPIQSIQPAQIENKTAYKECIEALSEIRGAPLYFPYMGSGIGNGSLVRLLDGSIKFDMITGIGVNYFGHSPLQFLDQSIDAALSDVVMQGNLQQNSDSLEFASLLVKQSGLPHCFLTTSGAMANENGLKIALQKNSPANRILAFDHCFAGRTLLFSQVTDKPTFREGLPLNIPVDYIPFYDPSRPEESLLEAKQRLLQAISRYPKSHAAMIFELIQGEGGFYPGTKHFFETLMHICKEHKIAVFADEVQTFGRTSELFAFQHFGLSSYIDIVSLGKLSQIAATLFSKHYCPKPGLLSQTFIGSTSGLKIGKALIESLIKGNFFGKKGRNMAIHQRFLTHFERLEKQGLIRGPYGLGCMIAFTPLDGSFEKTTELIHALFDAGVITFIAGSHPWRIRMLVPGGVITDQEINQVMQIIETSLNHVSH